MRRVVRGRQSQGTVHWESSSKALPFGRDEIRRQGLVNTPELPREEQLTPHHGHGDFYDKRWRQRYFLLMIWTWAWAVRGSKEGQHRKGNET